MKKRVFVAFLFFSFLFIASHAIEAQGGGKAEPNRISFRRGAHSSTVNGKVKGDEQAEYVFGAGGGQIIDITIAAVPVNAINIELHGPNGELYQPKWTGRKWTGNLPETGDYLIYVKIAQPGPRKATYTLTLAIR